MRTAKRAANLLVGCLVAFGAARSVAAAATPAEIRRDYLEIADRLPCGDPDANGEPNWAGDEPMAATLKRVWPLVGEWAAAYLDRYPRASAAELADSFAKLQPTRGCPDTEAGDWRLLRVSVVQLAAGRDAAYAIAADQRLYGTLLVVARQKGGSFRVAWTIKDVASQGVEDSDAIGWKAGLAGWEDGPLHGGIRLLSPDSAGAPRFAVDASPMGIVVMGCTQTFQLSMWRWDGTRAQPLLMKCYSQSLCAEEADHVPKQDWDHEIVRIPVKSHLETMSPFGSDVHPQAIWKVRVGPDGVEDLGEEWAEPDLLFVDRVLARVLRMEDTADVIDAGAAAALYEQLEPRARRSSCGTYLGTFGRFSVETTPEGRIATMHGASNGDVDVSFTIVDRDQGPFITAARVRWPE